MLILHAVLYSSPKMLTGRTVSKSRISIVCDHVLYSGTDIMLREIRCQSLQGVERLKQFSKADVSVFFVNNY